MFTGAKKSLFVLKLRSFVHFSQNSMNEEISLSFCLQFGLCLIFIELSLCARFFKREPECEGDWRTVDLGIGKKATFF